MVLLISVLVAQPTDPIQIVREGYLLDISDFAEVGLVFDAYRWFDERQWTTAATDEGTLVVFRGEIPDERATEDFHDENKYAFHTGMKAMQLSSYYQLDEDKQKLAFTVRFLITERRGFRVHSGRLGIQSAKTGEWREVTLDDRALLAVVEGIYGNDNPYLALVEGLPFE